MELIRQDKQVELKNWVVYNFPVDYSFIRKLKYNRIEKQEGPACYKATFQLDEIGDTFLDMSTWGKGMVWVNGHAMGRFLGDWASTNFIYAGMLAEER